MALPLAKAGPLKPEIKLAQALSEFEAILSDEQKTQLRGYRAQSPPNSKDVMRFTAEIDRDAIRNRKSRQCVGTRLTNVLRAVQQFSTVVDLIVGSSQSQIAGAIWGTVKISLQLASSVFSYFDQLSALFMRVGLTCPRYQDFGHLYPEPRRLQTALCEYFIVIVLLCKQAVLFLKKPFWSQLSSSILKPFEVEFSGFQRDLEILASAIQEEVSLASNQAQQHEAKEMSRFRAFVKNFSDTSTQDIEVARTRKRNKAVFRFLDACSVYNQEKSWKQARKRGNTNWICHEDGYKLWKQENVSSSLWCTGILGSGKTVLSANVVEDLKITTSEAVAYFFCAHDEAESLEARTVIGSIARQIFDHILPSDIIDAIPEIRTGIIDIDQILTYLQQLLPSSTSHKYFIIIDGLDECEEKERRLILQCLKQLIMSKHVFRVYCSSRPDVFRWARTTLEPRWNISMSQTSTAIEEYVKNILIEHLKSETLSLGDSTIILIIQDALLKNAHGMFLWVVFQVDSLCSQQTDEAILAALEDLPKDLPDTFNRILRKLQHSDAANPRFCKKVFDIVAAAQRPLNLEELREAVSVKPGDTSWDASKLVNDILTSLLDSCGSLIAVDEEHQTVSFTHHSVKQHLLSEPVDSEMRKYHINMEESDLYLGDVIVTYLNFGVFDRQLAKVNALMLSQANINPSAILERSLPRSKIARLAVKLLEKGNSGLDIQSQLKIAAGIVDESKEQIHPAHRFLPYAQEYWLFHTKRFKPVRTAGYELWKDLVDEKVKTIELPWALKRWRTFSNEYMEWIIQNEHWALINRSLVELTTNRNWHEDSFTKVLLEFLEKKATDVNVQNVNFGAALYLASLLNNKRVVILSLRNGVDVNAEVVSYHGTALGAASGRGHEEIVRLLLENGANVNTGDRFHDNALLAASEGGHEEIVRLLLENGANVNTRDPFHDNALLAASRRGRKAITKLLLENGADVNAEGQLYGPALQVASELGHEEIVRLLLENGAEVNSGGEYHGTTALQSASARGHTAIARLLLENGADVNAEGRLYGPALQAASKLGHEEIVRLLLENGAKVNSGGGYHGTALQSASTRGHKAIARLLLENGADVNAGGGAHGSALQAASRRGEGEILVQISRNRMTRAVPH